MRILLDAGHGEHDLGAVGPTGLKEKDVNLQVVLALGRRLAHAGLEVRYTREDDRFLPLDERARRAREVDLFLSIHHNATAQGRPPVNQMEVYLPPVADGPAWVLGQLLLDTFRVDASWPFPPVPDPWPSTYRVLRSESLVGALTEAAYLSDPEGETFLRSRRNLELEAELLYRGILRFLECYPRGIPRIRGVRRTERSPDLLFVDFQGPMAPASLHARWGDHGLPLLNVEGKTAVFAIPEDLPAGEHALVIRGFTPEGYPALPFQTRFRVERPVNSFQALAYPLHRGLPSLLELFFRDHRGAPVSGGKSIQLKLRGGQILQADATLREDGTAQAVIQLERDRAEVVFQVKDVEEEFEGMVRLERRERGKHVVGRLLDAQTGDPIEKGWIRSGRSSTRSVVGGWFFLPVQPREDGVKLQLRVKGYRPAELGLPLEDLSRVQTLSLQPVLEGVFHGWRLWLEVLPPAFLPAARLLCVWLRDAGAEVRMIPDERAYTPASPDRVLRQIRWQPDGTLVLDQGDEALMGVYPRSDISRAWAEELARRLNRLGWSLEVGDRSFFRLIQYDGRRIWFRIPHWDLEKAYRLFTALALSRGARLRRVLHGVVMEGDTPLSGVRVWVEGQPGWVRTDGEGRFTLYALEEDPQIRAERGKPTLL